MWPKYSTVADSVLRLVMQYSITFCRQLEAASNIISGRFVRLIVPDNAAKFRDSRSRLNLTLEILSEALGDAICGGVFARSLPTGSS